MKRIEQQQMQVEQQSHTTRGPSSLRELGVPGPLASELEVLLQIGGKVKGGRILGYSFVTPDGARHALCVPEQALPAAAKVA
jgi:hypothetical protein